MKKSGQITKNFLYYLPRVLSILLIIFFSVFALDAFEEPHWFLALLIHLIPSIILIALTIVAHKHGHLGGILFLILGVIMIFFFHSFIIALPALVIGLLFLTLKKSV